MYSSYFHTLSREGQTLVLQAMENLRPKYDPQAGRIARRHGERVFYSNRSSMYYALGLMLLDEEGCAQEAEKICNAVIAQQYDAPEEIYHGAFRNDHNPVCVPGALDHKRLGVYGRYLTDLFYERVVNQFRLNMEDDPQLAPLSLKIEQLLGRSVLETYPVVWSCYDPNYREFIIISMAMLMEYFSDKLSSQCVENLKKSCLRAMEACIYRSRSNFTPLNTNVQCMHVFLLDFFGVRFDIPEYREYALEYAEMVVGQYLAHHSAAEFNSPTYCGVDLATLGFWRRYGSCERLRELGTIMEEGIWEDMMAFYNPAMQTFCGPYSRAYELDMKIHTNFPSLLHMALGEEKYPEHPFNIESDGDLLLVFGDILMPESAKKAVFEPKEDVVLTRQFRELSERGDPDNNNALCTATAWISPDMMTGAMAGSENPSHQLHPLVAFWRGEKGIGTIKVLRSTPDGDMNHLHTVYFNGVADRQHLTLDVDFAVNRDVKLFFEIEYPDVCNTARITADLWKLPCLNLHMQSRAPEFFLEKGRNDNVLKVCYLSRARIPETKQMSFDMTLELVK
ncbi:MAG: hypothetical protein IJ507_02135 [Clostridia bacterium]|nr:hypothetical protein [Clostridia bacterium]